MGAKDIKKVRKVGNFFVTKVDLKRSVITGIYFDKKYERLIKLRDRQAYIWFVFFAILEGILRPYIFHIVMGLALAIIISNILFYFIFIKKEETYEIKLSEKEFFDVVDKKHRAWRQNFSMALVFVCMARLLIFIQPGQFSDNEVTAVYIVSLALSFFTIFVWLYFSGIRNQLKRNNVHFSKKKGERKHKRMKYIQ